MSNWDVAGKIFEIISDIKMSVLFITFWEDIFL